MEQRFETLRQNMSKCEPNQRHLDFVASVYNYWTRRGGISPSQRRYFESLESIYSIENIQKQEDWRRQYSDEQRDIACKMADYYDHQQAPYFSDLVRVIKADRENHVLSQRQFTKMCMNKYAVTVLEAYKNPPLYSKGQAVELRKSNRVDLCPFNDRITGKYYIESGMYSKKPLVGFVLDVNCKPITRAAKGSKIYQVLFAGELSPVYLHESDIKKCRR